MKAFKFYKTPIPEDSEGKAAFARKLAEKYNLSLLQYSRAFVDTKVKDQHGPDDMENGESILGKQPPSEVATLRRSPRKTLRSYSESPRKSPESTPCKGQQSTSKHLNL